MAGMERKGSTEAFRMRPLECCIVKPRPLGDPGQVLQLCGLCGMDRQLPERCDCFSPARVVKS
jgi:hypothetical protein